MKNIKDKINTYEPITCKTSGKVRFETYQEASNRALEISRDGENQMRAYYCDDCNGYHLTTLNKVNDDDWWQSWKRNN